MVKIYIAMKRRLSVGDKMAGRHGNKGCGRAPFLPEEEYGRTLPDGTPVEIVFEPAGCAFAYETWGRFWRRIWAGAAAFARRADLRRLRREMTEAQRGA